MGPIKIITDETILTPAIIADYNDYKRKVREDMTLLRKPVLTLTVFISAAAKFVRICIKRSLSHPVVLFFLIPAFLLWLVLEQFPGPHKPYIDRIEFCIEFVVWWVGLGILSSIGLGSGLQSGVLFVFPHVIEVCLAAQACNTLDFETDTNMWFRSPERLFQCPEELTADSTPVTYLGTWRKIIMVCFLQAAGTAIGEIPPYWMTRSARYANIEAGLDNHNETLDDLEVATPLSIPNTPVLSSARDKAISSSILYSKLYNKCLKNIKVFMIQFLKNHGFFGVLMMASFPNIAFDICGVFCGHYLMPFWTFFIATFVGKAIIRNGIQSLIFVALCSEEYMEWLIVLLQNLAPDSLQIDHTIREVLEESRASFHKSHKPEAGASASDSQTITATIMYYWQLVMAFILVSFMMSCISQFAQHYQMTMDNEEITKWKDKLMKQQMLGDAVNDINSKTPLLRTQIPFITVPLTADMPQDMSWMNAASPMSPFSLMLPGDHHSTSSPTTDSTTPERGDRDRDKDKDRDYDDDPRDGETPLRTPYAKAPPLVQRRKS